MTTNDTPVLSLADIDQVLPTGYQVLLPDDPRNDHPHALRVVRHEASGQTRSFSSVQDYLAFVISIEPRKLLLAEEGSTRYLLLSAQYDADPWFHASVTYTIVALTRTSVILHRMKSDETSVRFVLTQDEMATLIEDYQAYQADCEREEVSSPGDFDPFLADVTCESER